MAWRQSLTLDRETAPLRQAEDALLLDTSHLDFDQSREALLHMIKERIGW